MLLFSLPVVGQGTPAAPVRGVSGDLWADTIIGQIDFNEFMPNQITGNRLFNPGGVLVDRSVRPNRLYVYDSNSRVLGFDHLGTVTSGNAADIGKTCTSNSDYPSAICTIEEGRPADIVIGQPSFDRGACNGDGNLQTYPVPAPASASTLCGMPSYQISTTEGGSLASLAVDIQGNLYVPDWMNSRVLRYNSPFTTDTIADAVWGQADFAGSTCNRGRGFGHPDAQSLCFPSPYNQGFVGGAAVDAAGNLWISDNANNRVLRFPFNAALGRADSVANLVLGQPNFTSSEPGLGLNQMLAPAGIRISPTGRVYVADSQHDGQGNGRVLYFDPPLSNGMTASGMLNYDFRIPSGLEFDVSGGLWVSDRETHQLLLFSNPNTVAKVLFKDVPDSSGQCGGDYVGDGPRFTYEGNPGESFDLSNVCDTGGSIGVDSDGNVFVTGSNFVQDVLRFPVPIPTPQPGIAHSPDARIFKPYQFGELNSTTMDSLWAPRGIAVTNDQLMISDQGRILFWNNPLTLVNDQTADGYIGTTDPRKFYNPPDFGRIRQDQSGHLWALRGSQIQIYQLPLTTGQAAMSALASPLPVLGGGSMTWENNLLGGGIVPAPDASWIWVADPQRHRVFRIRDPLTTPVVDVILGQTSLGTTACNEGRGQSQPSRTSLCYPGGVALDPQGNLYVSDHALEVEGNHRLLEFDASLFPLNITEALFGVPASRVIGANGSFTGPCQTLCGPFEPTFNSTGMMVVGLNAYIGSRFPLLYPSPLENETYVTLQDYGSMPYASVFDLQDNLYIIDKNRGRALIYRKPLPDGVPPTVDISNLVPTNDAADVPVNTNITIAFSEPVTAAESSFNITCGTVQAFTLSGSGTRMLVLNPTADLPINTNCTAAITGAGVIDAYDNVMTNDFALSFMTGSEADTTAPTASLTTPAVGMSLNSSIVVSFSEAVNLGSNPVTLVCSGESVAFTTIPNPLPDSTVPTLTLDPLGDLPLTALCTVTLNAAQVVDRAGNLLSEPLALNFRTVIDPALLDEAPTLNTFATATPMLSWSRLSWAVSYEVEIFSNETLTEHPAGYESALTSATNSLALPTALPDGIYYFRVRGRTEANAAGTYSAAEPFTIDADVP